MLPPCGSWPVSPGRRDWQTATLTVNEKPSMYVDQGEHACLPDSCPDLNEIKKIHNTPLVVVIYPRTIQEYLARDRPGKSQAPQWFAGLAFPPGCNIPSPGVQQFFPRGATLFPSGCNSCGKLGVLLESNRSRPKNRPTVREGSFVSCQIFLGNGPGNMDKECWFPLSSSPNGGYIPEGCHPGPIPKIWDA